MQTSYNVKGVDSCQLSFEERLRGFNVLPLAGANALPKQTTWTLLDVLTAKHGLPHRSCTAWGEILKVMGPTRHELVILAGVMGVRMAQAEMAYLKHEDFPISFRLILMDSIKLSL